MTRGRPWPWAPALLCAVLLAPACHRDPSAALPATSVTTPAAGAPVPAGEPVSPPSLVVRGGGRELSVAPWSFCWSGNGKGVCADGSPPASPPDLGRPAEVEVDFAVPGFGFTATSERYGQRCGRAQSSVLESTGATTYRLRPMGAAGDYVVTLFGKGQGGDLSVSFRWHTPVAGPNEPPTATASIVAGDAAAPRSYGIEVSVQDLRSTPAAGRARARVTVTSGDGRSMTVEPERRTQECVAEGTLLFQAPQEVGQQLSGLGPAPFRYEVRLTVDSETYVGTATWPDDMKSECSPCTPLRFSPPLPGL